MSQDKHNVSPEQVAYANWLQWGTLIGLIALLGAFAVYLFGMAEPHVSHDRLAHLWSQPLAEYLRATGAPTGWSWVAMVGKGDYLNYVGIVILSGISLVCYLRVLPFFARSKEPVFVAIIVLEVLLIVLAASGVLVAGH